MRHGILGGPKFKRPNPIKRIVNIEPEEVILEEINIEDDNPADIIQLSSEDLSSETPLVFNDIEKTEVKIIKEEKKKNKRNRKKSKKFINSLD